MFFEENELSKLKQADYAYADIREKQEQIAKDYEIAKIVVEMKAEIEKIREQIQNLE